MRTEVVADSGPAAQAFAGHESQVVPYVASVPPDARSVLVFAPHPDDEVFGPGGCLALHAASGARVTVVLLTSGDAAAEAATGGGEGRESESRRAAEILGVDRLECWRLPDRGVRYGEPLVRRMQDAMVAADAAVVYGPSLWEAHPDHRAAAMAVIEAVRRSGGGRTLMCYEVSAPLRPNCLVDISSVWPRKAAAMAAFASQNARIPYPDYVGSLNRYRAFTLPEGVERAEAFERLTADDLRSGAFAIARSERDRLLARAVPALPEGVPLVSILIRTLGRSTLADALDSVAVQTYPNLEVVVVDAAGAGLPDLSATSCGGFPLRVASRGVRLSRSAAANLALESAAGDYLLFLDDDDWLYPDHVARLAGAALAAPDGAAFHTGVACVDAAGKPTGQDFEFPYAPRELCYGNFMPIHGVLFARRLVDAGCRFDESFDLYEDWDFWLQVERHSIFRYVPGISAAYRIADGSGAGVLADRRVAEEATRRLYAKWGVLGSEDTFQELISRALQRRGLLHSVARLEADRQQAEARRHQLTEALARAEREADSARQSAHGLKQAHDAACASRDLALGARDEARAAAVQARDLSLHYAAELERARVALDEIRQENVRMGTIAAQAQGEAARAQGEVVRMQQDVANLLASTSWRLTRPVRAAGRILRKVRTVAAGYRAARARHLPPSYLVRRSVEVFRREGLAGLRLRLTRLLHPAHPAAHDLAGEAASATLPGRTYADWVAAYDTVDAACVAACAARLEHLTRRPLVSIVMPVYNAVREDLAAAIDSVLGQIYPEWELCICDDASTAPHVDEVLTAYAARDGRIRVMKRAQNGHISVASNDAIAMARGEYIAFLDHDDMLRPHSLLRVVEALAEHPDAAILYSDEDKVDASGRRFDPYFKSARFNLGLLRSHNYMCHFAVYAADLLRSLGGLRAGYEGAQDYDLVLRAVDAVSADRIVHLPHILYHWRTAVGSTAAGHQQKNYAFAAGQRAIAEHLARRTLAGEVLEAPEAPGMYRVRFAIPDPAPRVSIIIPTRNGATLVRQCLDSLRQTRYPAYEIILVDNGSDDPDSLTLFAEREAAGEIRVLRDDAPFNFSALNNRAVRQMARGEFVLLMNNDIEALSPEWLDEMVGPALEPGVGCVGARLWYPDGRLQHGGVVLVCGVAGHAHKYLPKGQHGYMGRAVLAQDMVAVTAACLLVRRSIFDEVGGLDEQLAVAFNDVDFCLKVHAAGYRNHWTPYAELVHHESVTRGYEDTPEKQRRFRSEIETMQQRWAGLIADDPCYSPNLTADAEDFSLAWPPRTAQP